jgi:predicted nucleotidyltransferase/biotin operon repressor
MRFHNQLDDLLGNRIQLRLLRILARTGGRGLTGRELARMCGASSSQANASLQSLEDSGLVVRTIAGRAYLWRMAARHALAPVLTTLFREEAESLNYLKSDIETVIRKLPVTRAILYGAVARGDGRATSDVDLLLLVHSRADKEKVEEAVSRASPDFAIKFGNPLSALVKEERQMRSSANPGLLTTIRKDGIELETSTSAFGEKGAQPGQHLNQKARGRTRRHR